MEESCQPESLSSFSNVSEVAYYVRSKVELCIQNYMSLEVTAKYLEKNHKISKSVTRIVWEQLREENPDFFSHFEMRCQMTLQMRMFKDMLTKQAVGMFENGLIDICDASPSVKALLRQQHPDRVHLLETLVAQTQIPYNQHEQVLNPASFAMPSPNVPIDVQSQNPYDQQEQVINPGSFTMPNPSGPPSASAAQWQIPYEQLNQHLYPSLLAFSDANVTQLPIPYDQQEQQDQHLYTTNLPLPSAVTQLPIPNNHQNQPHQDPCSTYNDLIFPTFAPADTDDLFLHTDPVEFADLADLPPLPPADTTNPWSSFDDLPWTDAMPTYLSIFELGGDIMSAGMDLNEQQLHLNEPHWEQQQNVQVQGSNRLENGDELFCNNNFDITPPMQTDASLHQQLAGGVDHHLPESEALNNPESGVIGHNGPSEQPQHLYGHYQPQQNVSVETVQRGGGRSSNGMVNGESSDHQRFCNNIDKSHSKRMCTTSVEKSGRVKRHHHEPEALNNPTSGDGTQTTDIEQQRSPKARETTRSVKEWEQCESEETKQ